MKYTGIALPIWRSRSGNGEQNACAGAAVEFGDNEPRHAHRRIELHHLAERVLATARIEHQQHLMRRRGIEAFDHAANFL